MKLSTLFGVVLSLLVGKKKMIWPKFILAYMGGGRGRFA